MNKVLYLNECSFLAPAPSERAAHYLFDQLLSLLREIDRRCPGMVVVSHDRLTKLTIGPYPIAVWLGRDRDRARRLKGLQNRSPFDPDYGGIGSQIQGELEWHFDSQAVIGLGLAAWYGALAISVDRSPWQQPQLTLQQYLVEEGLDGRVREVEEDVRCRNACNIQHASLHTDWIDAPSRPRPNTPDELWLNRHHWYPNIDFLPSVEPHIRGRPVGDPALLQIAEKLAALQRGIAEWTLGSGSPDWGIDVTPENEGRHRFCLFRDLDGTERLFELHARFTPGENRIHFRLHGQEPRIIVAYIGRKLGI